MRRSSLSAILFSVAAVSAGQNEVAFTLGGLTSQDRLGGGTALQANYAFRLYEGGASSFLLETHFLASPQRKVGFQDPLATADVASLFVTPAIRVAFAPRSWIQPWISVGGGYALYEQSELTQSGLPNSAPRHIHRGALQYGGGADFRIRPWLALRGEIRDFYTGSPAYNVPNRGGGQHNLVVGGGFVLRFGE